MDLDRRTLISGLSAALFTALGVSGSIGGQNRTPA